MKYNDIIIYLKHSCATKQRFNLHKLIIFPENTKLFYSEIPLPYPNSSYLLEPSNPMANTEMRIEGYITTLTRPLGYSSLSSHQIGHMTTLFTSLFLLQVKE